MNNFKLKDNEIMIFTDFNNTLVDFENEYNFLSNKYDENNISIARIKINISKTLNLFEKMTGLTPVICIVTNASAFSVDSNCYAGIIQDLHMTFFDHFKQEKSLAKKNFEESCERFFRFLIYRENDYFFHINPLAETLNEMFVPYEFSEKAKQIKMIPQFKKKESVERMLTVVDPDRDRISKAIFAGDSIKDDYPMKLAKTNQGTCKFFIRPGKSKTMKPSLIYEFCVAKGYEFSSIHPNTNKKIKILDDNNIRYLNRQDKMAYDNYSDGDIIYLTSKNSRGLCEGLEKVMYDIIRQKSSNEMSL